MEQSLTATHPVYGVTPIERVRQMSGLAFMEALAAGQLPPPPIAQTLDFRLVRAERGLTVFEGTPDGRFLNPLGSVHGGWAATLLDACMGCAAHTTAPLGQGTTSLETKVNFVRAIGAKSGPLRAEGRVINVGRTVVTVEGRLADEAGKLYAHGSSTCLVISL